MPTLPKVSENLARHLTREEAASRRAAEAEMLPERTRVKLERPALMSGNPAAARYWRKVLARMEGLAILDNLDSEALGVYCVMLSRYEEQSKLLSLASGRLKESLASGRGKDTQASGRLKDALADQGAGPDPEAVLEAVKQLDQASGKMQSLERNILQYAEKLGLTPSGRIRLAQKRAEQMQAEADGDLFGD